MSLKILGRLLGQGKRKRRKVKRSGEKVTGKTRQAVLLNADHWLHPKKLRTRTEILLSRPPKRGRPFKHSKKLMDEFGKF